MGTAGTRQRLLESRDQDRACGAEFGDGGNVGGRGLTGIPLFGSHIEQRDRSSAPSKEPGRPAGAHPGRPRDQQPHRPPRRQGRLRRHHCGGQFGLADERGPRRWGRRFCFGLDGSRWRRGHRGCRLRVDLRRPGQPDQRIAGGVHIDQHLHGGVGGRIGGSRHCQCNAGADVTDVAGERHQQVPVRERADASDVPQPGRSRWVPRRWAPCGGRQLRDARLQRAGCQHPTWHDAGTGQQHRIAVDVDQQRADGVCPELHRQLQGKLRVIGQPEPGSLFAIGCGDIGRSGGRVHGPQPADRSQHARIVGQDRDRGQ